MTKPFQSIRQLFGRMLGGKSAGEDTNALAHSTLGINAPDAQPSMNGNGQWDGDMSPSEIEVQTADTQRLPKIDAEFLGGRNGGASQHRVAPDEGADEFGDALLDLGDVRGGKAFASDDPILDVFDETGPHDDFFVEAIPETPAPAQDGRESVCQSGTGVSPVIHAQDARATENAVEVAQPEIEAEESAPASVASPTSVSDLSPEAIDAIAQRVVAQLSDKVVREIAWEVVPELSELLIKQKLDAR